MVNRGPDNRGDPSWAPQRRVVVSPVEWVAPISARYVGHCSHCGTRFGAGTWITRKRGRGWCIAAHVTDQPLPAPNPDKLPAMSYEQMQKPVGAKRAARNGNCECCGAPYGHLQLIRFDKAFDGWVIDSHPVRAKSEAPIMRGPVSVATFRGIAERVNLVDA